MAKVLSATVILLGLFVIICWYLNIPALTQVYPDWAPMEFDILSGILLIVVGAFLAFVVGLVFSTWRKGEHLQELLESEISERKKVERDLARAQEITKTGNWVLDLLSHKMQWSNEVCRILDYSPDNKDINFHRFLKSVHPDDRSFVESEIQNAFNQGTAFNLTHRIVRRDSSIRMVKQRSEIYLDQDGEPTQVMGTLQDVTEQKEAENLAARLGRIVDKSFNEVYIFDAETLKFTRVNLAARLNLRYSMEELREMTPVDLKPEYTQEQFEKMTNSLKRGAETVTVFETVHKRNNGTLYPVDIRLQYSKDETRPQFVAIVQDISDRKKATSLASKAY